MLLGIRHRLLTLLPVALIITAVAAREVRARADGPNTWTTTAPLPKGLIAPVAASSGGRLYVFKSTIEVYNPGKNTWVTRRARIPPILGVGASATTGADGRIYLYGFSYPHAIVLAYDPGADTLSHLAPPPGVDGSSLYAALLVTGRDGRIYAVSGTNPANSTVSLSAYSLSTHTWETLKSPTLRGLDSAARGSDGRIYVIGRSDRSNPVKEKRANRIQAYDPATHAWSPVASLPTPRDEFPAIAGPDGRIYAIGGEGQCFAPLCNVVEAYDTETKRWTAVAPLPHPRAYFAAAVGPDGRIYVLGGRPSDNTPLMVRAVDVYTVVPAGRPLPSPKPTPTSVASELSLMPTGRENLAAVTGRDGMIYAIGGQSAGANLANPNPTILRTVESYTITTNRWASLAPLPYPRWAFGAAVGPDGRIYVFGGADRVAKDEGDRAPGRNTVQIYDPTTHRWSVGKPMPDHRAGLGAVNGPNGRIYILGGETAIGGMGECRWAQCERIVRAYDPRTNTWLQLASLRVQRVLPAAVLGSDGRIYAIGGFTSNGLPLSSAEVYDPKANRWTAIAKMNHGRAGGFAAAVARDGRIYIIGGCIITESHAGGYSGNCNSPSPVDAYDPRTNSWKTVGLTLNVRQGPAAATGPDGRVYAIGGAGDGSGRLLEVLPAR